jgi:broad specificity phosphatase PhoE
MKLIMIRHPVTITNIQGYVGHNLEGEIAPEGYRQINRLVKRLLAEQVNNLFSSDSKRCVELAEAIGKSKGLPIIYDSLFREIDNGDWSSMSKTEIERSKQLDILNTCPLNGESLSDLSDRVDKAFDLICRHGGKRNILFSHGYFLKLFLGNRLGLSPKNSVAQMKFSNCAMSEINISHKGCSIEYLNNRDYLYD